MKESAIDEMTGNFHRRDSCPVCGFAGGRVLYRRRFDEDPLRTFLREFYEGQLGEEIWGDAEFELLRCADCALIYQPLLLNDELLQRYYDETVFPKSLETRRRKHSAVSFLAVREFLAVQGYFGRPPAKIRVLDFGMGFGQWCAVGELLGFDVAGCELSRTKKKWAVERFGVAALDMEGISARTFDFINTEQVFEHLAAPRETFSFLMESLAPGGLLRISVPNAASVPRLLRGPAPREPSSWSGVLKAVSPLGHVNGFNRRSLARLGEGCERLVLPSWENVRPGRRAFPGALRALLKPAYHRWSKTILCFRKEIRP